MTVIVIIYTVRVCCRGNYRDGSKQECGAAHAAQCCVAASLPESHLHLNFAKAAVLAWERCPVAMSTTCVEAAALGQSRPAAARYQLPLPSPCGQSDTAHCGKLKALLCVAERVYAAQPCRWPGWRGLLLMPRSLIVSAHVDVVSALYSDTSSYTSPVSMSVFVHLSSEIYFPFCIT